MLAAVLVTRTAESVVSAVAAVSLVDRSWLLRTPTLPVAGRAPRVLGHDLPAPCLNDRVSAIHPDLQWGVRQGARVTHRARRQPRRKPAGTGSRRAMAGRGARPGRRLGVPPVPPGRPGRLLGPLRVGRARRELSDLLFTFTVNTDRRRVDVTAYHPGFADVPEGMRAQITCVALDWLPSEDAVEIWVGPVEVEHHPGRRRPATGRARRRGGRASGPDLGADQGGRRGHRPLGRTRGRDDAAAAALGPLAAVRHPRRRRAAVPHGQR